MQSDVARSRREDPDRKLSADCPVRGEQRHRRAPAQLAGNDGQVHRGCAGSIDEVTRSGEPTGHPPIALLGLLAVTARRRESELGIETTVSILHPELDVLPGYAICVSQSPAFSFSAGA